MRPVNALYYVLVSGNTILSAIHILGGQAMRLKKPENPRFYVLAASCLLILPGCGDGSDILFRPTVFSPFTIVGDNGNELLYVGSTTGEEVFSGAQVLPADLVSNVYSLDLVTLETELALRGLEAEGIDLVHIIANDRWIAWIDRHEAVLMAHNRLTGMEIRVMEELSSEAWFTLEALDGDWLAIHRRSLAVADSDTVHLELIVLDLESGDELHMDDVNVSPLALRGDRIAFTVGHSIPMSLFTEGWVTDVEVADLMTGERQTIAANLTDYVDELYLVEDSVIWQQSNDDHARIEIHTYDLTTARMERIADSLGSSEKQAWLLDVEGDVGLVSGTYRTGVLAGTTVYELRTSAGAARRIVEFPHDSLDNPWAYWPQGRFVGDFVVWSDPRTAQFVVFDPASSGSRSFDPREVVLSD